MRHETALRRLRAVAARCQRASGLWEEESFLTAAYAFGAVLDSRADLPVVRMAFVLALPAEELTWCTQPQSCVGLPHLLEIDKAPVEWYLRPSVWPVANHAIRRPLRVWSLDTGPDGAALDALARGKADSLRLPEPSPADLREQLAAELAASRTHLRTFEAGYWSWIGDRPTNGSASTRSTICGMRCTATSTCSMRPGRPDPTSTSGFQAQWTKPGSRSDERDKRGQSLGRVASAHQPCWCGIRNWACSATSRSACGGSGAAISAANSRNPECPGRWVRLSWVRSRARPSWPRRCASCACRNVSSGPARAEWVASRSRRSAASPSTRCSRTCECHWASASVRRSRS